MGAAAVVDADNFRRVVRAVVKSAGDVPVTIKVRIGMSDEGVRFREAGGGGGGGGWGWDGARSAWSARHALTARQMYSGKARWEYIGELKALVKIPVLGNGDVFEAP